MRKHNIRTFELIGRPGAGKTTIIDDLSQLGVAAGTLPTMSFKGMRGLWGRVYMSLRYPLWSSLIYGAALSANGIEYEAMRKVLSVQRQIAELTKQSTIHLCLIDEGVIHRLSGILYGSQLNDYSVFFISQIIKRLADRGVGWIYLDKSAEQCVKNFRQRRTDGRFDAKIGQLQIEKFLNCNVYDTFVGLIQLHASKNLYVTQDSQSIYKILQSMMDNQQNKNTEGVGGGVGSICS
jgi:hypothetical protein